MSLADEIRALERKLDRTQRNLRNLRERERREAASLRDRDKELRKWIGTLCREHFGFNHDGDIRNLEFVEDKLGPLGGHSTQVKGEVYHYGTSTWRRFVVNVYCDDKVQEDRPAHRVTFGSAWDDPHGY